MKRKFASVLALVLVFSICTMPTAQAHTNSIQASKYLSSYSAYVWAEGKGNMSIYFDVQATGDMDELGALSIRLQEKASGSSTWKTVKSFSHNDYSNMLSSDYDYYGSNVSYSGKSGYSYRAYVTIWAGKNGSGDSREILTGTITA